VRNARSRSLVEKRQSAPSWRHGQDRVPRNFCRSGSPRAGYRMESTSKNRVFVQSTGLLLHQVGAGRLRRKKGLRIGFPTLECEFGGALAARRALSRPRAILVALLLPRFGYRPSVRDAARACLPARCQSRQLAQRARDEGSVTPTQEVREPSHCDLPILRGHVSATACQAAGMLEPLFRTVNFDPQQVTLQRRASAAGPKKDMPDRERTMATLPSVLLSSWRGATKCPPMVSDMWLSETNPNGINGSQFSHTEGVTPMHSPFSD